MTWNGKTDDLLERSESGGADGARTRDLQRDRLAF